jgi:AraC-like DNA-binding protein
MRRLKQEGTSHSTLLDSLRREHAERYLRKPSLGVAETAFLLGFSDASAFIKAFRRWFGMAPLEFRRRSTQTKDSRPAPS